MPVRRGVRGWAIAAVIAGLVGTALAVPDIRAIPSEVLSGGNGRTVTKVAALDRSPAAVARRTGKRVEVTAERAADRSVYANPDGSHTAELYAEPIRARRGKTWVAIDTRLRSGSDGRVRPGATATPMSFSGGGTGPLVTIGGERERIELSWPSRLPKPRISGDTVTYPEVFPGVDLTLRAGRQGFTELLVVKTPQAARDPRLARISYRLRTVGVTLTAARDGSLSATNAGGTEVFHSPPPAMWDSPPGGGKGRGTHQAVGTVELTRTTLTVVPDQKLLRNPDAVYPILIDPDFGAGRLPWQKVFSGTGSGTPSTKCGWDGYDDCWAKSGKCYEPSANPCNGIGVVRTYFRFDIGFLRGRRIIGAQFNLLETWSPSCTARPVDLYHTGPFGEGTVWSNQPAMQNRLGSINEAHGYGSGCPAAWIGWGDGTTASPVGRSVSDALNSGSNDVSYMVRAADETDILAWKKFSTEINPPAVVSPNLSVRYNSYPDLPTNVSSADEDHASTPREPCAQGDSRPYHNPPAGVGPVVRATGSDPDGGSVRMKFEWWKNGQKVGDTETGFKQVGSEFQAQIPDQLFPHGTTGAYRAAVRDDAPDNGGDYGAFSPFCEFTVDRVAPAQEPGVSSAMYPEHKRGGGIGRTGTFTFDAKGDTDVVGFAYALGTEPGTDSFVAADAPGGTAAVAITPETDGSHDLYVRSVDRAGNRGPLYISPPKPNGGDPEKAYHFGVGEGTAPVARWALDGHFDTRNAHDGSGYGHHATLSASGADWTTGRVALEMPSGSAPPDKETGLYAGDALRLNGSTGYASAPHVPQLDTNGTFSVTAWVLMPTSPGGDWKTVVSMDGGNVGAFYLQYAGDTRSWQFRMEGADSTTGGFAVAKAPTPARLGVWTHLVGSYDVATNQMRLYVDGRLVDTEQRMAKWPTPARGSVQIGRAKWGAGYDDYFPGAIDEVRLYDRLLSNTDSSGVDGGWSEIRQLALLPSREELHLTLDEASGATTLDASGNHRPVTVSGAVTRTTGGRVGTRAVSFDGTDASAGVVKTAGPVVRTDASFTVEAWVKPDAFDSTIRTAVSQDGSRNSGFYLQYHAGRWAFAMVSSDTDNPARSVRAESSVTPVAGVWTHLTGVYDAAKGELRIYVNGAGSGTAAYLDPTWHAGGALVVGRAKYNGNLTDRWKGAVDGVRVFSGARTPGLINKDRLDTAPVRLGFASGELARYVGHNHERTVSVRGRVPQGHHLERPLGIPATAEGPNTRLLYSCVLNGVDQFVSTDPGCEGQQLLEPLMHVYTSPPTDRPSVPIYRCLNASDHSVSNDPNCEGWTTEFLLGYLQAYAIEFRFTLPVMPYEHTHTTGPEPAGYRLESRTGLVALTAQPDTTKLYDCRDGDDQFQSTDATCDGKTVVGSSGWIWTTPPTAPTGIRSAQLFRCRTAGGELFQTLLTTCEGQTLDRSLGYVVTRLPA